MRWKEELEPYLAHLRRLPFVVGTRVQQVQPRADGGTATRADALVLVRTPRGAHEFLVELKKGHLTEMVANDLIARAHRKPRERWLLFAAFIPTGIARLLVERGIGYVDEAGNCFLAIGEDHVALIEGRRRTQKTGRGRGMGVPGHRVLFALIADPELVNAPVRHLARIAGTSKTAAAHTLERLQAEGLVARGTTRRHLLDRRQVLDRWLAGYATIVRPRMIAGTYRLPDRGIEMMEKDIERALGDTIEWAWGGGAAAMRLTKHYRGQETVLHVRSVPGNLAAILRALPAKDGPLTLLKTPGEIAFQGAMPRTVHPLLVYTELLATNDERARETAEDVWNRFLSTSR